MVTLRPYQREAKEAVLAEWEKGRKKTLLSLPTGCHAKGQKVLLADGTTINVENVRVGMRLLGADGKARTVLMLHRGTDEMFKVIPVKGEPFVVNSEHKLSLVQTTLYSNPKFPSQMKGGEIVDVAVKEWLCWSNNKKHIYKLFRSDEVDFPDAVTKPLEIDPYFLGVLLGDGNLSCTIGVTTMEPEVVNVLEKNALKYNMHLRAEKAGKANTYLFINNIPRKRTQLKADLSSLGVLGTKSHNKFVPNKYKTADVKTRLEVIAGLLDTDGALDQSKSGYDFISKSKLLADDLAFMCRSVGLAAYVKESFKKCPGFDGRIYYRVHISGDCSKIPCRVERRKAQERKQKKSVLRTGFSINPAGRDDYYGFTVDGDNRYLMEDFTITHNCGKTIVFSSVTEEQVRKGDKVLILAHREELLKQAADKLENTTGLVSAIEKAEQTSIGTWNRVVVGSVQSLAQDKRLNMFKPDEFGTIIIDEAHHALSPTYQKVLEHFSEAKVLGVTATPDRGDRKDLGTLFESLAYDYSIVSAIKEGYLSPIKAQTIPLDIDISQVGMQNGDFATGEIATALDPYLEQIAEEMKKYCKGRKTLVFLPLIATSQKFAKILQEKGFRVAEVNGQSKDREQILKDFEEGKYDVLCNALLLTEGYDCPSIDCIVMLRPTKIRSMYCLDEQTEILTNDGWKTFETFSMLDKVATFNPETEMINFEKSLAYIHRPLNENECFYSLNSPSLDIRVTNKHRMLYDNKRGKGWKFKTVEDLAEMKDGAYLPISGKGSFKGVPLSDDELRFIGWVMTDGSINKHNNVIRISQSDTQEWLNDIEECLKKCNFKYGKHINNSKTQFKRNGNNVVWYISKGKPRVTDTDKRGWGKLEKYISKDIADELFFNISEEQFEVMLEAINLADGHKQSSSEWQQHSYHIGKGNKRFIERLQIMAIQRGYKANLTIQTENRRKNPYYVLHMKKKTKACCGSTYDGRPVWKKEDFKEENCWCVETPTGTLITRRHGKVAILGNCQVIGRGTRLAEGKEYLLVLDFLWHTQRHDLCRPAHLIAKDEVYAQKMTEKYAENEEAVDLLEMEEAVTESVLEERENALAAELRKQRMKKAKLVDPLQYEMSIAATDLVDYVPEFGWQMLPPSEKQIETLENLGIYGGDIPNSGYASMLIERVEKRKASGLSTPKQIRQLENRGFVNVGQWSFQDAQKLIGRIAKCGWRVPPGVDPVEYSRKVLAKK